MAAVWRCTGPGCRTNRCRSCVDRGRDAPRGPEVNSQDVAKSDRNDPIFVGFICLAAWAVPGAGHLWLGRVWKGVIFLVAVPLMFAFGLVIEGRIFPFEPSQPLVLLAALADLGIGIPYFVAGAVGLGDGRVVSTTYEYGNSFLIVAGLLNLLVVLDAFDITQGRK